MNKHYLKSLKQSVFSVDNNITCRFPRGSLANLTPFRSYSLTCLLSCGMAIICWFDTANLLREMTYTHYTQ